MTEGRQAVRAAALQTALVLVTRAGNVEAARLLVSRGASVQAADHGDGQTPLMWAAAGRHPEMVRFLLAHGADPNARTKIRRGTSGRNERKRENLGQGGLTPLLYAAREGCVQSTQHLLEGGAQIDLPDVQGTTPLMMALTHRRFGLAAHLIHAGADVTRDDVNGRTPLSLALDPGNPPSPADGPLDAQEVTALQVLEMLLHSATTPDVSLPLEAPCAPCPLAPGMEHRGRETLGPRRR